MFGPERLLSFDPVTRLFEYHSYDPDTDTSVIRTVGDCEPFIEQNKLRANDAEYTKQGIKNEFWHYASIPPAIQVKWLIEDGIDVYKKEHGEKLSRKLMDPEYRFIKTTSKNHKFR